MSPYLLTRVILTFYKFTASWNRASIVDAHNLPTVFSQRVLQATVLRLGIYYTIFNYSLKLTSHNFNTISRYINTRTLT